MPDAFAMLVRCALGQGCDQQGRLILHDTTLASTGGTWDAGAALPSDVGIEGAQPLGDAGMIAQEWC